MEIIQDRIKDLICTLPQNFCEKKKFLMKMLEKSHETSCNLTFLILQSKLLFLLCTNCLITSKFSMIYCKNTCYCNDKNPKTNFQQNCDIMYILG